MRQTGRETAAVTGMSERRGAQSGNGHDNEQKSKLAERRMSSLMAKQYADLQLIAYRARPFNPPR